jgi:hypothetical protein
MGSMSINIHGLLILIVFWVAQPTVLGLIPAVLAAQTGRGFIRWWFYGTLLSLAVLVIFAIAGLALS